MARPITAGLEAETLKPELEPFILAEFEFGGGIQRFWTGGGDLIFDAKTWQGVAALGQISGIEETMEAKAAGVAFQLNGLNSALVAIALGQDYRGRPARVYLGAFDPAGAIIIDPVLVYAGRMDVMGDRDDGQSAQLTLTAENHLVDLRRPRQWRYTDQDQQQLYPGDLGCEFVASLQNKVIVWGG